MILIVKSTFSSLSGGIGSIRAGLARFFSEALDRKAGDGFFKKTGLFLLTYLAGEDDDGYFGSFFV